jgi:hypothetical protein
MKLNCRVLYVQKAGAAIEENQDAYHYSIDPAVAAVSDGAGAAPESRLGARILARRFVELPPSGQDRQDVLDWLSHASAAWRNTLPWHDMNDFQEVGISQGPAATLVGLRLEESEPEMRYGKWSCTAMGDSCLFQVADGHLATAVPLSNSAAFGHRPSLFHTRRDLNERDISELVTVQGTWHDGDSFVLLTDAIAEWFLREAEQGLKPWEALAAQDERSFGSFVDDRRDRRLMRNDDVTAVTLGILTARPRAQRPQAPERGLAAGPARGTDRIKGHAFISYVRED